MAPTNALEPRRDIPATLGEMQPQEPNPALQGRQGAKTPHERYLARRATGYYDLPNRQQQWRDYEAKGRHPCSDCSQSCSRTAVRCKACAAISHGEAQKGRPLSWTRRIIPLGADCPFCTHSMRDFDWHGRTYYHCGICGFEKRSIVRERAA